MELIETKTATADGTSSIIFSSIPQTYTDLKLVWTGRSSRNVFNAGYTLVQFNGSTSDYTYRTLQGEGSGTPASQTQAGLTTDGILIGGISNSNNTADSFGSNEMYIPNYTSSNFKSVSGEGSSEQNATGILQVLTAGLWSNTAAITSITLKPWVGSYFDWVNNSTFYLYGISNVTSTTKATGGIVSSDGTYNYHMFPYSGTFTPTEAITADYLVVAGGGGGSYGGGGAGGLRSTVTISGGTPGTVESALSLTAQAYTVTVGAGGAAGSAGNSYIGQNGSNSVFSTITSTGGGGAAYTAPAIGGSGGGRGDTGAGAAGTANQGFAGGAGTSGGVGAGGGGGAGAVGGDGTTSGNIGGNGGNGRQITAFANPTQTGTDNGYYAGGGGGGYQNFSGLGGLGGLGGGGRGTRDTKASAGVANTGGGGAGSYAEGTDFSNGGSGIVIIRYAI